MDVVSSAPLQINIQVCTPRSLSAPAARGYDPYQDSNPGYPRQNYFGGVQDDLGWMQSPFQGPGQLQPFNPYMPGGGFGAQDAQMSAYFQQMQTVLSMQIAVLDRMIAILMMQMQMQQGQMPGQGYPPGYPPQCGGNPPQAGCDSYPEPYDPGYTDPYYPTTPAPYYPPVCGPTEPPVSYDPPPFYPLPAPNPQPSPETWPTPEPTPEPTPAPPSGGSAAPAADPSAERQLKVNKFKDSLLSSEEVRPDDILRLATAAEVPELGEKLLTVLSLGETCESFNMTDAKTKELVDIFFQVAKANGDVSVLAGALQRWAHSDNLEDDYLNKETYEALASVAGNPEGADRLARQLDEANGWNGGGCNLERDKPRQVLEHWSKPTVAPAQKGDSSPQARAQVLAKLAQGLERTHGEVDARAILSIALEAGLDEQEARSFITFLYSSQGESTDESLNFDDPQVRDMVGVYVQAGQANGDVRVLARALQNYSQKSGRNLREVEFDALAAAAGQPAGVEDFKEKLGQQSSWDGSGCNVRTDDVQKVLNAAVDRSTAVNSPTDGHRQQQLDRFQDDLLNLGEDQTADDVRQCAVNAGLDAWEGDNLCQFLSVTGDEEWDFYDEKVVDLVKVYFDAAKSGGTVAGVARALRRYRDSDAIEGEDLSGQAYDALVAAAAGGQGQTVDGAEQLRFALEPDQDEWEDGIDLRDDEPNAVLNNTQA